VSPIVVIDNLFAQFQNLDRALDQSVVMHMKCFTHTTSLVHVHRMMNAYFTEMKSELRQAQRIFQMQPAVGALDRKCPEFVITKSFYDG
jgi:hypothetical protein